MIVCRVEGDSRKGKGRRAQGVEIGESAERVCWLWNRRRERGRDGHGSGSSWKERAGGFGVCISQSGEELGGGGLGRRGAKPTQQLCGEMDKEDGTPVCTLGLGLG